MKKKLFSTETADREEWGMAKKGAGKSSRLGNVIQLQFLDDKKQSPVLCVNHVLLVFFFSQIGRLPYHFFPFFKIAL